MVHTYWICPLCLATRGSTRTVLTFVTRLLAAGLNSTIIPPETGTKRVYLASETITPKDAESLRRSFARKDTVERLHGAIGVLKTQTELEKVGWISTKPPENFPLIDLTAQRKTGPLKRVNIQVKTISRDNRESGWKIEKKNIQPGIAYVLVELPRLESEPTKFLVLDNEEMLAHCDNNSTMNSVKVPRNGEGAFLNRWDKLDELSS